MKKMNVKKVFVATLALAAIGVCAGGVASSNGYVVADAQTTTPTPATLEMVSGASVRTADPIGIRFATYVNKSWIGEQTVEIGTIVIPLSKLTDSGTDGKLDDVDFNVDTTGVLKYTHDKETQWMDEGDYYKVNAVLSEIPDVELATTIAAKSYVKIGETITYATNPQTRSIAQVAYKAKQAGEGAEYLDKILDTTISGLTISVGGTDTDAVMTVAETNVALTVASTSAVTLKETPNLADFGLTITEETDLLTITEDGITPKGTAGMATITATAAGKSTQFTVKVAEEDKSLTYWNSGNASAPFRVLYTATGGKSSVKTALASDGAYVDQFTYSYNETIDYAMVRATQKYWSNYYRAWSSYKVPLKTITFDIYNTDTVDHTYTLFNRLKKDYRPEGSEGTLKAGEWTTITITWDMLDEVFAYSYAGVGSTNDEKVANLRAAYENTNEGIYGFASSTTLTNAGFTSNSLIAFSFAMNISNHASLQSGDKVVFYLDNVQILMNNEAGDVVYPTV